MKKRLTLAVLLLLSSFTALAQVPGQVIDPITISYTELFDRIAAETDSVFRLSNVIVEYNEATDSLFSTLPSIDGIDRKPLRKETLVINKAIELVNVRFVEVIEITEEDIVRLKGGLYNIRFNKSVSITYLFNIQIYQCEFMGDLTLNNRYSIWSSYVKELKATGMRRGISLEESTLHGNVNISSNARSKKDQSNSNLRIYENIFLLEPSEGGVASSIILSSIANNSFRVSNNVLKNKGQVRINDDDNERSYIHRNDFNAANVRFDTYNDKEKNTLDFDGNTFNGVISLRVDRLDPTNKLDFEQFNGRLISGAGLNELFEANNSDFNISDLDGYEQTLDSLMVPYFEEGRVSLIASFNEEIALRGMFFNHFKAKFNTKEANAIYVDMKDVETARLKYEYDSDPTFETFFTLQINRFLKTFSAYGTKPAKAVVFSAYVILLFALVYLFFPNHWDSHGKNRIKDRFMFFHKYLRLNKGIQDVYLEGQSAEIESSHAFRKVLDDHRDDVPPFFYNAAKPLLKWSTASIILSSSLLRRLDFLKGSWKDTAPKVRGFRTALTILIFIIALCYDMLIKMLNALMLSINTFTTLGFGEIPIKGLPRYLAIVQGFIGWFMLTIFSVSLISQLLN